MPTPARFVPVRRACALQIFCVDAMLSPSNSCAVGRPAARAYRNLALLPSEIAFLTKVALFHMHVAAPLDPARCAAVHDTAVRALLPEPCELSLVAPPTRGGGDVEAEEAEAEAVAAAEAAVCNGRVVSEYLHEPFEAETWAIMRQTLAHDAAPEAPPPTPCAACAAAALTPDANYCSICGERVRRCGATTAATAAAAATKMATATAAASTREGRHEACLPGPYDLLRRSDDLCGEELARTEVRALLGLLGVRRRRRTEPSAGGFWPTAMWRAAARGAADAQLAQ
jgi:hypothetical protein